MKEKRDGEERDGIDLTVAIRGICAAGMVLTLACAVPQTASAQTAPAQTAVAQNTVAQNGAAPATNSDALEEVVVTAERRNTSEQTTPISMEALSGAQIAEKNFITVTDIQQAVPSMTVNNGGLFQSINIRGIGNSVINPSIATGVAVMRDGHFQPETIGLSLPFYDIADVEVLRGPQGTYIGASSTGGAVLINSANPNFNGLSGYAETLFGDYADKKVTGAVNLPINDTMAARIAFNYETRNSFYKDIGADYDPLPGKPFSDPGQLDNQNIRISYLWKPTDNFQALLKFEFNHSNTDGTPDQPNQNVYLNPATGTFNHSPYYAYSTHSPFTLNDDVGDRADVEVNNIYGLELKYTLPGDIVLRSMTGLQHNDVYQTVDVDATCAATCVPVALQGEYPGVYTHHTIGPNNNYKSQEFNLTSSADGPFTWIVGGWYFYRDTPVELVQYNSGYPDLTNAATAPEGVTGQVQQIVTIGAIERTSGIFADAKYKFTSQWEVELGVRGNHDDNSNYGAIEVNLPAVAGGGQLYIPNTGSYKQTTPTAKLGVNYTPIENQFLYAFVARGYKAGGINNAVTPNFAPEHVTDYEVGWKSKLFDDHLITDIGGFWMNYQGLQQPIIQVGTNTGQAEITNLGDSKIKGIEATIQGRAAGFTAELDLAYDKSTLGGINAIATYELGPNAGSLGRQCPPGVTTGCFNYTPYIQNLSGEQNPYAPEFTANLSVDYAIPVGDNATLRPKLTFEHMDKQYASIFQKDNYYLMGARELLNGSLNWESNPWLVQVYCNNLTDRLYVSGYTGNIEYYGNPRQIGIRVNRTF
jgi:iron complex outermembrane receptor protein